jgi:hypothetical protein
MAAATWEAEGQVRHEAQRACHLLHTFPWRMLVCILGVAGRCSAVECMRTHMCSEALVQHTSLPATCL